MRTPICEQLDIDLPIFAFSHCRDVPPLPHDIDMGPTKAAGINVDEEGPGQVSLQHEGVKMLVNALGTAPKLIIDQAHEHGVLVGALVGSKQHAERQVNIEASQRIATFIEG